MRITRFTGLNTIDNPLDVGLTGLVEAKNVDLDNKGHISSRPGYTKILSKQMVGISGNLFLCADGNY